MLFLVSVIICYFFRKCQIATKNYHRRLLQRCLAGWHLCCRMQRERDAILAQQEGTRHKMAALIDAVSTSKLNTSDTPDIKPVMTPPEADYHQKKVRCALSNSVKFFECEG